jgi:hypothetical protein
MINKNLTFLEPKNTICIANLSVIPSLNEFINKNDNTNSNILKLNKVVCKSSNNQTYKIVRYDKDYLNCDLIRTYGLLRSMVLNSENKIVCFSPPKSIPSEEFIRLYSNDYNNFSKKNGADSEIVAEEFVEGTMINVFWDSKIGLSGSWEISTRNTVGADTTFYKSKNSKTFRTMFLEAAAANNLILENLNPNFCYSFVLQHPENRIVVPFKDLKLYLIAIYYIDDLISNDIKIKSVNIEDVKRYDWGGANIHYPKIYEFDNYTDLINKYASMNTSYDIVGFVLRNKLTGERCKIRNPVYEQVRSLRGNQPKLQYQYLSLRKEGRVKDFLAFYPENKNDFSIFREQLHLFTNTLFSNYISCYVKKEQPLNQYPNEYRTHMFNLHKIFMDDLREKKQFITNTIVIKYVNNLHPSLLMFCLNFQMRKRNIDTNIAYSEIEN